MLVIFSDIYSHQVVTTPNSLELNHIVPQQPDLHLLNFSPWVNRFDDYCWTCYADESTTIDFHVSYIWYQSNNSSDVEEEHDDWPSVEVPITYP